MVDMETGRTNLPGERMLHDIQLDPIRAYKFAHLVKFNGKFMFRGGTKPVTYGAEDYAVCTINTDPDHEVPSVECTCGFYGVKDRGYHQPISTLSALGLAIVHSDFYGRVIEHTLPRGGIVYRAKHQRVLAFENPDCRRCWYFKTIHTPATHWVRSAEATDDLVNLYGTILDPACMDHAVERMSESNDEVLPLRLPGLEGIEIIQAGR